MRPTALRQCSTPTAAALMRTAGIACCGHVRAKVGDSLLHDVAGANAAGVDSLFVAAGIHAEELVPVVDQTTTLALSFHPNLASPTPAARHSTLVSQGVPEVGSAAAEGGSLTIAALERLFSDTGVKPTMSVEAFVW